MAWSEFEPKPEKTEQMKSQREDAYRVLATAASKAVSVDGQEPLKKFLVGKANGISYRPGAQPAEVAFEEGQRSLALQILKLAGEV